MTIALVCACGKRLQVQESLAGKKGKCPACGRTLTVPTGDRQQAEIGAHSSVTFDGFRCAACGKEGLAPTEIFNDQQRRVLCKSCFIQTPSPSLLDSRLRSVLIGSGVAVVLFIAGLLFLALRSRDESRRFSSTSTPADAMEGRTAESDPDLKHPHAAPQATGNQTSRQSANERTTPAQSPRLPFEQAFRGGSIDWEPVENIQMTTQMSNGKRTESFAFVTKFKYDEFGRRHLDRNGETTYRWPGVEATFGKGAAIRITKAYRVAGHDLEPGDVWIWDGTAWKPQNRIADAAAESDEQNPPRAADESTKDTKPNPQPRPNADEFQRRIDDFLNESSDELPEEIDDPSQGSSKASRTSRRVV